MAATTVPSVQTATSIGGTAPVAPPTLATIPGTGEETGDSEIERRLALPRFAYVGESDMDTAKYQQGADPYSGAAAFIDSRDRHSGGPAARRAARFRMWPCPLMAAAST